MNIDVIEARNALSALRDIEKRMELLSDTHFFSTEVKRSGAYFKIKADLNAVRAVWALIKWANETRT